MDENGTLRTAVMLSGPRSYAHVLVTWIRKVVSLAVLGFFTWVSLVVVMTAMMIGADAQSYVANFWYSVFISVPVVLAATVLRVFVPWFQVHLNGPAVRPRLDSSQR
ncbi:hypothetical protein SAMN06309944_1339 [Micrococcales bacterium KH10]|nr:hypothetical protein SAMN06309944_1339 [Micrococcales bacterium KH10]